MRSVALALACSCVLAVVGPSWTMEEAASSMPLQPSSGSMALDSDLDSEGLQSGPEKRVYSYVSEYKRLPIYNFGLGKRWSTSGVVPEDKRARLYSFGLGKRARPYSFGLGKRGESYGNQVRMEDDYEEELREPLDEFLQDKRSRLYSFGLGKRTAGAEERGDFGQRFNFGLGKRPSEAEFGRRYKFGLGKRRFGGDEEADQRQIALASQLLQSHYFSNLLSPREAYIVSHGIGRDDARRPRRKARRPSVGSRTRMNNAAATSNERCKIRKWRFPGGLSYLPVLLLVVILPPRSSGIEITWRPDLDWTTKSNWVNDFVPENGSRVVFPVEMRLSVGLPARNVVLDVAGLQLPRDGGVALPKAGRLTISESDSSAKTAEWKTEGPLLWADPNNWSSKRSLAAIPHLERLPCQDDVVVLPAPDRVFSVRMPNAEGVKVKGVRLSGDLGTMPSWDWRDAKFRSEFAAGPASVEYSGLRSCTNCPCQPERTGREMLEEVCEVVKSSCETICDTPIRIEGHCCDFCGGRVQVTDKTSLNLLKKMADQGLSGYGSSLSWYVRSTWDSRGEILIAGKDGKYSFSQIDDAMLALANVLKEQGIEIVDTETTGFALTMSKTATILLPIFGTLVVVVLVFLVIFPYFGYPLLEIVEDSWSAMRVHFSENRDEGMASGSGTKPRLHIRPFRFARFQNTPDSNVELATAAGDIVAEDEDEYAEEESGIGSRFANPLYRSGKKQTAASPNVQSFAALRRTQDAEDLLPADDEVDLTLDP
ncbi:uncharacterized protein LOC107219565 [Neodiprion lecontei]|uniref:Protein amnionless n=2 Tax=Neodiprion TaxID=270857 RepID=A0A6J0BEK2_NEOLC|nr:uncharacterized protein LOC107219565 [Neodiprion lecontei]